MKIEIIKKEGPLYFVAVDDLFDDELTGEEALMVVSTIIVNSDTRPKRIPYLKTQEEHDTLTEKHGWKKRSDMRHI